MYRSLGNVSELTVSINKVDSCFAIKQSSYLDIFNVNVIKL